MSPKVISAQRTRQRRRREQARRTEARRVSSASALVLSNKSPERSRES